MRIRRGVAEALPRPQAASSSRTRSPPAPLPPPAPPRPPAPCSETTEEPSVREANRSTPQATADDDRLSPHDRNRQEEVKEEKDTAAENEKRGVEEDERSEHEHGRPVHVVCSTGAKPKGEKERRAEVDGEKREDPGRVKDEEKNTVRICKKGDGKGWQCKRTAQPGYSLCQYHLDKLRSYSYHSQKKKPKAAASPPVKPAAAGTHSPRASQQRQQQKKKRTEERVVSTRPGASDSFYYYSGFGPRWGKRRGNRSADGVKTPDSGACDQIPPHEDVGGAIGEEEEAEEVEEVEEDVEEEEDYDYDGESRDGKPPKSRRLSSLL